MKFVFLFWSTKRDSKIQTWFNSLKLLKFITWSNLIQFEHIEYVLHSMIPRLHSGIEVMAEQSNRRQDSHEGFAEVLEGGQRQQSVGVKLG